MKLGFLASGRGSNFQAIVDACKSGVIDAVPTVVVCNNSKALVMERARNEGVDAVHLSAATHPDPALLDKAIAAEFTSRGVDVVVLAGYAKQIGSVVLDSYRNRILNVHPSLLPLHGGKGMYGHFVHEAVLASGAKETGASVHLVDEEYDQGEVLAQTRVAVLDGDDADAVAARLLPEEHRLFVKTLARISRGELQLP